MAFCGPVCSSRLFKFCPRCHRKRDDICAPRGSEAGHRERFPLIGSTPVCSAPASLEASVPGTPPRFRHPLHARKRIHRSASEGVRGEMGHFGSLVCVLQVLRPKACAGPLPGHSEDPIVWLPLGHQPALQGLRSTAPSPCCPKRPRSRRCRLPDVRNSPPLVATPGRSQERFSPKRSGFTSPYTTSFLRFWSHCQTAPWPFRSTTII